MALAGDWPIFGRDAEGVAWRPDPALAVASRLTGFLRVTGGDLSALDDPGTVEAIRTLAQEERP